MADRPNASNPVGPARPGGRDVLQNDAPLLLEQYFRSEIDLDRELASRFGAMPLMSQCSVRMTGAKVRRGVAMLAAQDGSAGLRVEIDGSTRALSLTFTLGAMLGWTFAPPRLSDLDRTAWLEAMRKGEAIVFLWGPLRWSGDYLIFAPGRHTTNVYAFSARGAEAGVRLTPEVAGRLLGWMERLWT